MSGKFSSGLYFAYTTERNEAEERLTSLRESKKELKNKKPTTKSKDEKELQKIEDEKECKLIDNKINIAQAEFNCWQKAVNLLYIK